MNVDRNTEFKAICISFPESKEYLDKLRKQADSSDYNSELQEGESPSLLIDDEGHSQLSDEYYFEDGIIHYSGYLKSNEGDTHIYLDLPISDDVLIDILQHASKKFNKLKTALESLK